MYDPGMGIYTECFLLQTLKLKYMRKSLFYIILGVAGGILGLSLCTKNFSIGLESKEGIEMGYFILGLSVSYVARGIIAIIDMLFLDDDDPYPRH